MIAIKGLQQAAAALARLDLAPTQSSLLGAEAAQLAAAVRSILAQAPGGDHASPWRQTGTLQDSIFAEAGEDQAVVASSDPVAIDQELGTRSVPPRPFLAPTGAAAAEDVARRIGKGIADTIRDALA